MKYLTYFFIIAGLGLGLFFAVKGVKMKAAKSQATSAENPAAGPSAAAPETADLPLSSAPLDDSIIQNLTADETGCVTHGLTGEQLKKYHNSRKIMRATIKGVRDRLAQSPQGGNGARKASGAEIKSTLENLKVHGERELNRQFSPAIRQAYERLISGCKK